MNVHVLTACSRPENLHYLAASLHRAATDRVRVHWHVMLDLEREHVGGQEVKNRLIGAVSDGWVWVLDDDTVAHPDLFSVVLEQMRRDPGVGAVVVAQQRSDGTVLHASPERMKVGAVDIGQAVIRRERIGIIRIPTVYDGDGRFLEHLLAGRRDVVYVDRVLSYHNALET